MTKAKVSTRVAKMLEAGASCHGCHDKGCHGRGGRVVEYILKRVAKLAASHCGGTRRSGHC